MKLFTLLGLLTLSPLAFSQTCYVDMVVVRTGQVLRTFSGWGDSACREGMKECRKSIRLDYSSSSQYPSRELDCVNLGDGRQPRPIPHPVPQPIPQPIPQHPRPVPVPQPIPQPIPVPPHRPVPVPQPMPMPSMGVVVTGLIESKPFEFAARDASELYINCLTDIRHIGTSGVDEIFFTVNNNRFVSASTNGWYNDTMICSILEQEARRSAYIERTRPLTIVGSLESSPFRIDAFDRASLLNSCLANISALRLGSTDEMAISVNGAPFRRLTTGGWWQNPVQVCKVVIEESESQM